MTDAPSRRSVTRPVGIMARQIRIPPGAFCAGCIRGTVVS